MLGSKTALTVDYSDISFQMHLTQTWCIRQWKTLQVEKQWRSQPTTMSHTKGQRMTLQWTIIVFCLMWLMVTDTQIKLYVSHFVLWNTFFLFFVYYVQINNFWFTEVSIDCDICIVHFLLRFHFCVCFWYYVWFKIHFCVNLDF